MVKKAFIKVVGPAEAEDKVLQRAYKRIGGSRSTIAHVHQTQSLHPKAMMTHLDLYMTLMYDESPLSRIQRELIGAVVSYFNDCDYCILHHYEALQFNWKDAPSIQDLVEGIGMDRMDNALVQYSKKLTKFPSKVNEDDYNNLSQFGFDDRAILDINLIIGYFNFVNRLVLGTGVELEKDEERNYNY
ncbi:MAG: carboxymuconolactone decarboxylase family protein [Candidatus Heimdallarchaeota archaeon]